MTLNEKRLFLFGISKINPSTFPDVNKPFKFEMTAQEWKEQFGGDNPWLMLKRSGVKTDRQNANIALKNNRIKCPR
jgi:hypothetical protein